MKTFRTLGVCAICTALIPSLFSCNNEDDDESGNDFGSSIIEFNGTRLTSLSCDNETLPIIYDDKGRISRVGYLTINYANNTIDDGEFVYNTKFSSAGLITQLSTNWDEYDDEYKGRCKGNQKMTFSYNSDGNISSINLSCTESIITSDGTYNFSNESIQKFTWADGNLVKAVRTTSEKDHDGTNYKYENTYTYTYGSIANKFLQIPCCITYFIIDEPAWTILSTTGLFGRGPKLLPTLLEERYTETGDEYNAEYSYPINFTLTDFGAIATETFDNTTYSYSYGVSDRSTSTAVNKLTHRTHFKQGFITKRNNHK